jgi:hypothetical protein
MEQEQSPPNNNSSIEQAEDGLGVLHRSFTLELNADWQPTPPGIDPRSFITNSSGTGFVGYHTYAGDYTITTGPAGLAELDYEGSWERAQLLDATSSPKKKTQFNFLLSIKTIKDAGKEGA